MAAMKVVVNEECLQVEPGTSLFMLRERRHPPADLVILNGHPVEGDRSLREGDRVVFIRKGVMPVRAEMEALMAARHSPKVHERVKRATVGIAGAGGLGSNVALALARTGVGRLVIADGDVVELSNLNRQQYFVEDIGRLKVEALRDFLARVNPFCRVDAHPVWLREDTVAAVLDGAEVVVEALDQAEAKAMLIDAVLKRMPKTPVVAASGLAGYGPGNAIRTRAIAERLYVVGDLSAEAGEGTGLMAPRVGIAAGHQANAVLRILMGEDPAA